jgi:hypothetical protein
MNEQEFEKLFRDRLTSFSQTPPAGVVDKINDKLKQRRKKVWVKLSRLAAALALIAISTYLIGTHGNPDNQGSTSNIVVNQPEVSVKAANPDTQVKSHDVKAIGQESTTEHRKVAGGNEPPALVKRIDQPQQSEMQLMDQREITVAELVNAVADGLTVPGKSQRSKVTITYKKGGADPEDPKLALQDQPRRKPMGIRSILKTAIIVDNHDISLAGIRATKDQLLAINKKEKNKDTKPN